MINLGTTDIYINVPSMPREEFERYSTQLFDKWETRIEQELTLPDYSLSLNVEEGSVKVVGTISALAYAVYMGIGNYGSFISGIETIRGQVRAASNFLAKESVNSLGTTPPKPKVTKSGGSLTQIQNLFVNVQSGKMTVEEAMSKVEMVLGEDAQEVPELAQAMCDALKQAPHYPKQIPLPLETIILPEVPQLMTPSVTIRRPDQPPNAPQPPRHQLRVEVWRESRKDDRKVRVIPL